MTPFAGVPPVNPRKLAALWRAEAFGQDSHPEGSWPGPDVDTLVGALVDGTDAVSVARRFGVCRADGGATGDEIETDMRALAAVVERLGGAPEGLEELAAAALDGAGLAVSRTTLLAATVEPLSGFVQAPILLHELWQAERSAEQIHLWLATWSSQTAPWVRASLRLAVGAALADVLTQAEVAAAVGQHGVAVLLRDVARAQVLGASIEASKELAELSVTVQCVPHRGSLPDLAEWVVVQVPDIM